LVVASWQGYQLVQLRMPLPQSVVERAFAGVEANEQWDPIRRDHAARPMALVPAGCFPMGTSAEQLREASYWCDRFFGVFGCPDDFSNEQPVHEVCFERPFWIDVYEVTNHSYGSLYPAGMTPTDPLYIQYQWPRGTVSWEEAEAHCRGRGARLPTEAEWEYAARGGLEAKRYAWGDDARPGDRILANTWQGQFPERNLEEDGFGGTAPVKSFPPNGYGLYDMIGNAWEWCADWYHAEAYAELAAHGLCENPAGPTASYDPEAPYAQRRVTKGGSYLCADNYCLNYRPSARRGTDWDTGLSHVGFRCVQSADEASSAP
jgi:formylglycine-generating enzyme required for sulfatase activity